MIQHLSMVTRIVEDQDVAAEFYTEQLGFEVRRNHPGPHGRFLTVAPPEDGVELILMTSEGFDAATAAQLSRLIGNDAGLIYRVEDCLATAQTLEQRGVSFRQEPQEMPWGIQAVLADPDGNEIVIQERPTEPES